MYSTLHSTSQKKTKENETPMIQNCRKHWKNNQMKYWLLKSEPNVWSIDQQKNLGTEDSIWEGVRNFQAANNLKKMKINDLCFFSSHNLNNIIFYN